MKIEIEPIAIVKNSIKEITDDNWGKVISEIILNDQISRESLTGIEDFSHLEIIYYFHKVDESKICLESRHPRNNSHMPKVGIFAQRGKNRPNRIGITIVHFIEKRGKALIVEGLDAIDGTPIIDIKPVMKEFLPKDSIHQPAWVNEIMKDYWG